MFDIKDVLDPSKVDIANKILSCYIESKQLEQFNILHIYPNYKTTLEDNDCFHDSLKFKVIAYNTTENKYRKLGEHHDQINFDDFYLISHKLPLNILRIFADGSVLIRFSSCIRIATFCNQVLDFTVKDI